MKKIVLFFILISIFATTNAQRTKRRKTSGKKLTIVVKKDTNQTIVTNNTLPNCVQNIIEKITKDKPENPPRAIYSYSYKGKTVYYVTAHCCDFFSDVYDENCNIIGHPDGGITGKGDMNMLDFNKEKSNEKLIWTDDRK